jgi:hypothetical protein
MCVRIQLVDYLDFMKTLLTVEWMYPIGIISMPPGIHRLIDSNQWAHVTASETSPTANPTRFVDPE